MEDPTESPSVVKVEKQPQCVILTYFHGDIGSMVDAHFSRALDNVCKAKAPRQQRKIHKKIKIEDTTTFQGSPAETYSETQGRPTECLMTFTPAEDPCSSWHTFSSRTVERGSALPPIVYSRSQDGLSVTAQQYSTSLLNLLHSDRPEVAPSLAPHPKAELLPNWTVPQVDHTSVFEPGQRLDKKDLYWY